VQAYAGGKRLAIVQSCYIPWKGYLDFIDRVDEFVLLDDAQYTRRDWRNRNRVKTVQGTQWLTVPVQVKGRYLQRIDETLVSEPGWAERHWKTLQHAYASASCFEEVRDAIDGAYACVADEPRLSLVNRMLLEAIFPLLGIETVLSWSADYPGEGARTDRLLEICLAAGATEYVSGPAARAYLDEAAFAEHGIAVEWMDYSGYPEYEQLYPPFEHTVTVLDVLFHTGGDAAQYALRRPVEAHEHA
jgi:WbqC-like protein family